MIVHKQSSLCVCTPLHFKTLTLSQVCGHYHTSARCVREHYLKQSRCVCVQCSRQNYEIGGAGGWWSKSTNTKMGTCSVKLLCVDCLQQLEVMPLKTKKWKIQAGLLTLHCGHLTEQGAVMVVSCLLPYSAQPEEELVCNSNTEQASAPNGPQERRGNIVL